jgi:hypothetical protein
VIDSSAPQAAPLAYALHEVHLPLKRHALHSRAACLSQRTSPLSATGCSAASAAAR